MWQSVQLDRKCKECSGVIIAKRQRDVTNQFCSSTCGSRFNWARKQTWKPVVLDHKCKICNGEILAKRKRDLIKEVCGVKCAGQYYIAKPKVYVKCMHCDKEFVKTCRTQNKYCSKKCCAQTKVKIHIRQCARCGKDFILKNIAYERKARGGGSGKYCSQTCGATTYHWDEGYFEKIDTEQKAYWLGFIAADGCVNLTDLRLHISEKDLEHLMEFKKAIKSTHPIYFTSNKSVTFALGSKKIVKDMNTLGIVPRKTFVLEYPSISKKLNRHFIRGVFDGDGCITDVKNSNSKRWSIYTASVRFKNQLSNIIKNETGITPRIYPQYKGHHIMVNTKSGIQALEKYLYTGATVYLKRKMDKFLFKKKSTV